MQHTPSASCIMGNHKTRRDWLHSWSVIIAFKPKRITRGTTPLLCRVARFTSQPPEARNSKLSSWGVKSASSHNCPRILDEGSPIEKWQIHSNEGLKPRSRGVYNSCSLILNCSRQRKQVLLFSNNPIHWTLCAPYDPPRQLWRPCIASLFSLLLQL